MSSSQYQAPTSLAQAVIILSENKNATILAGGTDLLVQLKFGLKHPELIVDIKNIPELMGIKTDNGKVHLGAATPGALITANKELKVICPGLVEAIGLIGSSQIQGRCSVGGNLCNASPAADSVPALMVNQAICTIVSSDGKRTVPVEEFNTGPGQNCLASNEILVSLDFVSPGPLCGDAYLRFIPRTEMDIAVVGAAVALTLDEAGTCIAARVAIGAVAPTALMVPSAAAALIGSKLGDDVLLKAGKIASDIASPISDKRGTAKYRKKVVGVMVRRAIVIAKKRAKVKV